MLYKHKIQIQCEEAEKLPDFKDIMTRIDAELRRLDLAIIEPNVSGGYILALRTPNERVIQATLQVFGKFCAGKISLSSPRLVPGVTEGVFFAGDVPEGLLG